jgi:hypothetical protein
MSDKTVLVRTSNKTVSIPTSSLSINNKTILSGNNIPVPANACVVGEKTTIINTIGNLTATGRSANVRIAFTLRMTSYYFYVVDIMGRGTLSDGERWVYIAHIFGSENHIFPFEITGSLYFDGYIGIPDSYGHKTTVLTSHSTTLPLNTDIDVVFTHNGYYGMLYIDNIPIGTSPTNCQLYPAVSDEYHYGDIMYNGGGRTHSALGGNGTISNISIIDNY